MKKYLIVLLCVMFALCGCESIEESKEPQPTEQQLQCKHEWVEIAWDVTSYSDGSGVGYDIYCPKCKTEKNVSSKEWNRIQADMNYNSKKK